MLTRNFDNLAGSVLQSSGTYVGLLPFTDVYGKQYFIAPQFGAFPYSRTVSFARGRYDAGISVGSGNAAPIETDKNLEATIESGISGTVISTPSVDGSSMVTHLVTVTNTSSETKTIGEIGYKQSVTGFDVPNVTYSNSGASYITMLDRTLVDPAITLYPGQACVIRYVLKTDDIVRTVNGVRCVSWQFGSDEDVAAMIVAAREGTIDLRTDGLWAVGDMRPVTIGTFSAGGVTHSSETIDLTITSFDEYEGCGNLMQVDFAECLATSGRMNQTSTASDGYERSVMMSEVLPAAYNAMPSWLRDITREFSVKTNIGSTTSAVGDVTGNMLALRSWSELMSSAAVAEGANVAWYDTVAKMRQKRAGRTGGTTSWWLRTAYNASQFRCVNSNGDVSYASANSNYGIAPFMCI